MYIENVNKIDIFNFRLMKKKEIIELILLLVKLFGFIDIKWEWMCVMNNFKFINLIILIKLIEFLKDIKYLGLLEKKLMIWVVL